jgi:hypothetical protein
VNPVKIPYERWTSLAPLFEDHERMRFLLDSMMQGYTKDYGSFMEVLGDSALNPEVVQIKMDSDIFFGGDPGHPCSRKMVKDLPKTTEVPNWEEDFSGGLVIPESDSWRDLILDVHQGSVVRHRRTEYSSDGLDTEYLLGLAEDLPQGFKIVPWASLIERSNWDLDRQGLGLQSLRDFLSHGIGFCVMKGEERVCEVTSWARCHKGVEVNVGTSREYQRMGLATACCARFAVACIDKGLVPHWSTTANPKSDRLAEKLGYVATGSYEVLAPSRSMVDSASPGASIQNPIPRTKHL